MHKLILGVIGAGLFVAEGESISQELLVRLTTPLTTAAKAGARFEAVVTGCAHADCAAILPPGSTIHGFVRQVWPVGFGVRRERASMALQFDGCLLPGGGAVPCRSELLALDNAREAVTRGNRIHGILAANHPHSFLSGLWVRPTSALLPRSISGLTGAGRMIYTGISPHPIFAGAIIVTRLAVFRLPEPEIHIPAGAEMILRVSGERPEPPEVSNAYALPENLAAWLSAAPVNIVLPDGTPAADIVNMAFRGNRDDIALAFLGAGWATADSINGRTFTRAYRAVSTMESYPTAPVSPLRYQDRLPDLVFQKSFNSMSKRHHIRLWQVDSPDGPVWLGAATHDVSIAFDWKRLLLTHRIDREIDRERDKVLADLSFAGCVAHSARVERPALAAGNARISTDGALHVVESRPCQQPSTLRVEASPRKKTSLGKAFLRRTILESRHYLLRGNGYYWAFRGLRSRQMLGRFAAPKTILADAQPELTKTSWRRGSESNRRMRALQTLALPLGYRAPR